MSEAADNLTEEILNGFKEERALDRKERTKERRVKYARIVGMYLFLIYGIAMAGLVYSAPMFSQPSAQEQEATERARSWSHYTSMQGMQGEGSGKATIAVIPIRGTISGQPISDNSGGSAGLLSAPVNNMVLSVRNTLRKAEKLAHLKEMILFIESPGGAVTPSDEIYSMIRAWREKHPEIIVSAYLYSVAASGGYWVAMAADTIASNPTTIVGSIGVMMQSIDVSELAEKLGIRSKTITTGEFKDVGNMFREMTQKEHQVLLDLATQMHERFVDVVDIGRPTLGREAVATLADGRIFSANDAKQHGLIDDIVPTFDAFVEKRANIILETGVGKVEVVRPSEGSSALQKLLRSAF